MDQRPVVVGRVSGLYGVKGWVRVTAFTEPRDNILGYRPWLLDLPGGWQAAEVLEARVQGKGLVVALDLCPDRESARALLGVEIAVGRDQLPALPPGEYYWDDLVGLDVVTGDGVALGAVARMVETGANDVMVTAGDRERWIPFLLDSVVREVDLDAGRIVVDWDPEF